MNIDLHCHSTASDGTLAAGEVVRRAAQAGVDVLALTDHDQLAGLAEAREAAHTAGIGFVDGVEVSTSWRGSSVHIVGVGINAADVALGAALHNVRAKRIGRARRIEAALAESGLRGTFDGAMKYAARPETIGRTHFARYLVEIGIAENTQAVFRKYLAAGKPGYVAHEWAQVGDAVRWIRAAGGIAIMAHPGRYRFSGAVMRELIVEFMAHGGNAIEVNCSSHSQSQVAEFGSLALHFGLAASAASDFHAPGEGVEFGRLAPLDARLRPVWQDAAFAIGRA